VRIRARTHPWVLFGVWAVGWKKTDFIGKILQ
jgi:hypothetical protein